MPQVESAEEIARARAAERAQERVRQLEAALNSYATPEGDARVEALGQEMFLAATNDGKESNCGWSGLTASQRGYWEGFAARYLHRLEDLRTALREGGGEGVGAGARYRDRWPDVPGRWLYKIRYYGGNVSEVRAPGLVEAAQLASERGRVVCVEEMYAAQPHDQDYCGGNCGAVVLDNGYCDACGKPVRPHDQETRQEESFAEIDAEEFEEARRDPVVQKFAADADAHLAQLRKDGRIEDQEAPQVSSRHNDFERSRGPVPPGDQTQRGQAQVGDGQVSSGDGEGDRHRRLEQSLAEVERERDEGIEALAALFVEGFECDFPEGKGIDGESSQLAWIADLSEVIANSDYPNVPSLLPDPGVSAAADRLRTVFAYWIDHPCPQPSTLTDEERERLLRIAEFCDEEPDASHDAAEFLRTLAGKEQR